MRRKNLLKKAVALVCSGIMAVTSLGGCSGLGLGSGSSADEDAIKIWATYPRPEASLKDWTESPFHVNLGKQVGHEITWEFPISGTDEQQAFNLMIAGNELPDIIIFNVPDVESYLDQGIILPLNEYMEAGKLPNLTKFLKENPQFDKEIKTDDGRYYAFPWVREDDWLYVFRGPAVRQDWLDECGLEAPVTVEEYDHVARVFHKKYGAKVAFVDDWMVEGFGSGFDATRNYYLDEDEIKYGPVEDNFREYLTFLHQWYEDGILDPDIPTIDADTLKKKVLNGESGLTYTSGNTMTQWQDEHDRLGDGAQWIGTSYLRKTKDTAVKFSQMDSLFYGMGAVITSTCKDVDAALEILDYGYSEEGRLFWNYGVEGDSYTMVDGEPVFTDKMRDPDSGLATVKAIEQYCGTNGSGPTVQAKGMYVQKCRKAISSAIDTWIDNTQMREHRLPKLQPTQAETDQINNKETTISDYVDEMYFKFIQGQEELNDETWKTFVDKIYEIGLDDVLDVKNAQLDRYRNR